ncbi:MAG TPA: NAD(P)H-binding protein [Gaiellaceae bacterium]|nr:NAD(P)H-binding protein [Gaiellaceae bacterium]
MKIAVIGSTGATGKLVLQEAKRRGHEVTAFARDADALARVSGLADVVEGDGRDRGALERAVAGQNAVIDAVGSGGTPDAISAVARSLTEAMQAAGVPRLVATSAYGMVAKRPYVLASIVRRIFRATFADQHIADHLIESSNLDWTIVRATRLVSGTPKRPARLSTDRFTNGPYSLRRAAYATALVDLVDNHLHSRQIVNITG